MATFERCDKTVEKMASAIIEQHHGDLKDADARVDLLFAYPRYNDKDEPVGDALKHHGVKALGIAKKIGLADRSKGMGDCEIRIDFEWWKDAADPDRRALLDHELHHFMVSRNKHGVIKTDDIGRPVIRIRPHDYQFGWFNVIAQRHGVHSQERQQANAIFVESGQLYWPHLVNSEEGRIAKLDVKAQRTS